jgi:hypothetical protein
MWMSVNWFDLSTGAPASLASNRKGRRNRNYELKNTSPFIKFRFTWLNNLKAAFPPPAPSTSYAAGHFGTR